MELTIEEAETIAFLRLEKPCIAMNDEAVSIMEQLTEDCTCPGCRFLREQITNLAMIEAAGETHQ